MDKSRALLKESCAPFPWRINRKDRSWHQVDCDRNDVDTLPEKYGPWVCISLRPDTPEQFPSFSSTRSLLRDTWVDEYGLRIAGFVCANIHEDAPRHYWFAEVINGNVEGIIYDSLKRYCPVRVEVSKKCALPELSPSRQNQQSSKPKN